MVYCAATWYLDLAWHTEAGEQFSLNNQYVLSGNNIVDSSRPVFRQICLEKACSSKNRNSVSSSLTLHPWHAQSSVLEIADVIQESYVNKHQGRYANIVTGSCLYRSSREKEAGLFLCWCLKDASFQPHTRIDPNVRQAYIWARMYILSL